MTSQGIYWDYCTIVGLIYQLPPASPVWLVDPRPAPVAIHNPLTVIPERAAAGLPPLVADLIRRHP